MCLPMPPSWPEASGSDPTMSLFSKEIHLNVHPISCDFISDILKYMNSAFCL